MGTNKHAIIRYQSLDRCFSNSGRRFYIEDLVCACNEAIREFSGIIDGVKKRQVQDDINFMESEQGWSIPLERYKDGKRVYYRYADSHFSINNQPLNETEVNQLNETICMLNRFKGMPQFEWMEELLTRLESTFHLKGTSSNVVCFEQNPYLKGLNFFSDIFNAIINKQTLKIIYKSFYKQKTETVIHPYFLKQYNNRWFLLGLLSGSKFKANITNLALDRIEKVEPVNITYIENKDIDFEEYFDDIVGVTVYSDRPIQKVTLKIDKSTSNYIETKPLHASQKVKKRNDEFIIVELNLQLNYELETLLLGYSDHLEVIEPLSLKEAIINRANAIIKKNL